MKIMANRMDRGFFRYQKEFEDKALEVLRSGWYVLGNEVKSFEEEFAAYTGSRYCVGLASGLDALWIAFRVLGIGPGDEVLVQGNTYIASVMGITMNGATPIFVEPDEYYNLDAGLVEAAVTEKTKAIMAVHLYGQAANMAQLKEIANRRHLYLLEDCAQSHGAAFGGRMTGTFGDIGCFSFYPTKNLGAFGDAGAVVTDCKELAERMRMLRNYGSREKYYNEIEGVNSRLDEIQAALLSVKLSHMGELTEERIRAGLYYDRNICNSALIKPGTRPGADHVYHQYVVRCHQREKLQTYLSDHGIQTQIHYPVPPHLAECYRYMGYKKGDFPITEQYADEVLSLPLYTGITRQEQDYVIQALNEFKGSSV